MALNVRVAAFAACRHQLHFAALSAAAVAPVFGYITVFHFRAHDGRRI